MLTEAIGMLWLPLKRCFLIFMFLLNFFKKLYYNPLSVAVEFDSQFDILLHEFLLTFTMCTCIFPIFTNPWPLLSSLFLQDLKAIFSKWVWGLKAAWSKHYPFRKIRLPQFFIFSFKSLLYKSQQTDFFLKKNFDS